MAITLVNALAFAADSAHDIAGVKADRIAHRWVEQALLRLWRSHLWSWYGATRHYVLDAQEETGVGETVTLTEGGGTAVIAGGVWPAKYVTQKWQVLFGGDGVKAFTFASLSGDTLTATFDTGQVWSQDTTAAGTYSASRNRYDLPDDFTRKNELLLHLDLQMPVRPVDAARFDEIAASEPGVRSGQPRIYTVRDDDLWIWPSPGSTMRPSLLLSYHRMITIPAQGADGATVLDWPGEHEDVFRLAVEVEAARHQGKAAQIPLEMCLPEFERALSSVKAMDTERASENRGMSPGGSWGGMAGGRPIIPYIGIAPGGT